MTAITLIVIPIRPTTPPLVHRDGSERNASEQMHVFRSDPPRCTSSGVVGPTIIPHGMEIPYGLHEYAAFP